MIPLKKASFQYGGESDQLGMGQDYNENPEAENPETKNPELENEEFKDYD